MRRYFLFVFLFAFFAFTAPAQQRPVVFAHVSDLHIGNKTARADLENTVNDINAIDSIQFVIITGDITEFGSREELEEAKSILKLLRKKWYIVPGNHDTKWSESGCQDFADIFGGDTFVFRHDDTWFIGTNSGPNMRMGPGQTPKENLVWLQKVLDSIGTADPVVYINHYPQDNSLNNWYVVLDMLRDHNVKLFMCGHGHRNKVLDIEGVPGIMGRSNLRAKDSVGGYNIVSIRDAALHCQERRPGIDSLRLWYTGIWHIGDTPRWAPRPGRPHFRVNDSFPDIRPVWTLDEPADIGGGMAFDNGRLYYTNTAGAVVCLNAHTKKRIWNYDAGCKIYSTPALDRKHVWVSLTNGKIVGLNKTNGKVAVTFSGEGPYVSSPVISGDTLFAAGSDGHCRAWHIKTKATLWDFNGVNNFVETRPLLENGVLYFGSWGNEFYALQSSTGNLIWKWTNGASNRMFSSAAVWPALSADKLYMVAPDRYMTVLDMKTGDELWRFRDDSLWVRESMGISEDRTLIFAKTMQGQVIAFDARSPSRKVVWIAATGLGYDICPTPIRERNGIVFVPTQSGVVVAFEKLTGELLWKHKISNCLVTDILPGEKNSLFVCTMDGRVVKLAWK